MALIQVLIVCRDGRGHRERPLERPAVALLFQTFREHVYAAEIYQRWRLTSYYKYLQIKHMKSDLITFISLSLSSRVEHGGHLQGQREQGGDGEHAAAI